MSTLETERKTRIMLYGTENIFDIAYEIRRFLAEFSCKNPSEAPETRENRK